MDNIIEAEKDKYNKIYTDLIFACDDLNRMLDKGELNKRTFLHKLETLKEYMNYLDKIEVEDKKKKNIFSKLFNNDFNIESKINSYLTIDKRKDIEKLSKCSNCKCKNCISECQMVQCYNCRESEYVVNCNKQNSLLTNCDEKVTLYNGDKEIKFYVKGYLIEKDDSGNFTRYIYLIDSKDSNNQHILKYSKFKGEERYDSVITDNTQDELIRINDKFIEMGLRV